MDPAIQITTVMVTIVMATTAMATVTRLLTAILA
jgi:hypothetical protein